MMLGQGGAKKHTEQRTSEDAGEHDTTDYRDTHDRSLPGIISSRIVREALQPPGCRASGGPHFRGSDRWQAEITPGSTSVDSRPRCDALTRREISQASLPARNRALVVYAAATTRPGRG